MVTYRTLEYHYDMQPLLTVRQSCFSDLPENTYLVEDVEILTPVNCR